MKKITFLFALLCASMMGFAEPYCSKVVRTTIDYNQLDVSVTVKKMDATTVRVALDNESITGIRAGGTFQQWGNGVWADQVQAVQQFNQGWTQDGTIWYKDLSMKICLRRLTSITLPIFITLTSVIEISPLILPTSFRCLIR